MARAVRIHRDGPVAVITVDHPPANVLTPQVRQALFAALAQVEADPAVRAVVLGEAKGGFPGQINPKEFDGPLAEPEPRALARKIEDLEKPVVALLSGQLSGAGAEMALAAAARVAVEGTRFGLRDALIGLPPSAGATQRLPRLVGAGHALTVLMSGRLFSLASEPLAGLVQSIVPAERADADAKALALSLAEKGRWVRTRERVHGFADPAGYQSAVNARRASLGHGDRPVEAAVLQAVESAPLFPFEAGMTLESELFADIAKSERSRGLRHAAVAETRVNAAITVGPVELAAIHGAGKGAARLTAMLIESGVAVILYDPDPTRRARVMAAVRETLDARAHSLGGGFDAEAAMEGILDSGSPAVVGRAEVIFDLSPDDEGAKSEALARIAQVASAGAVVLSMTRGLDCAALAPQGLASRVVGLHLPYRPYPARLAELVVARGVARPFVARSRRLMQEMGCYAVRVAPADGLVGPAMAGALLDAADELVRLGADPAAIDAALARRGMVRGAYRLLGDMDGDAFAAYQDRRGRQAGLSSLIAAAGLRLGVGADHEAEHAALASLVREAREGAVPLNHPWSAEEIWTAVLAAMVNEGARLLHEAIVARPLAIDVVMVHGYMFPRALGGPMHAADMMGLFTLVRAMRALAPIAPALWEPHPLLLDLQRNGRSFADLNG